MNRYFKPLLIFVLGMVVGAILFSRLTKGKRSYDSTGSLEAESLMLEKTSIDSQPSLVDRKLRSSRETAITRAVARVSSAVVGINVIQIREYVRRSPFSNDPFFRYFFPDLRYQQKVKSLGSGFLISPDGYILTNEHVVNQAREIIVTLTNGKQYEAKIRGADYVSDIALLKIEGHDFPYAPLGDSDNLIIGEWAIAIGNPFGLFDINAKPTVTQGVISAVDRDFGRQGDNRVYQDMIQTDASINGGNSGGPLVNSMGEVIGINTFIFSGSETVSASIGLGFAIPINRVKRILEDLKKYGEVNRRFWTGLEVEDVNPLIARFMGLKKAGGVIISNIESDSPAEKAGLEVGDIIVEVNDKVIKDTQDIWEVIEDSDVKGGDILKLKIFRKNRYMTVKIKLEEIPRKARRFN